MIAADYEFGWREGSCDPMGKKDDAKGEDAKKVIQRAKENYDMGKYLKAAKDDDWEAAGKAADKLREHLDKKDK
jgi:hypothetical protein